MVYTIRRMEAINLQTGYRLAAFPDYKSAKAYAEERQCQRVKVVYCGSIDYLRPMEVKRWPKAIPGKGYMDYRHEEKDYLVRHHGEQPPPVYGSGEACIRGTAELLGKKPGFKLQHIVVENRW